MRPRIVIPAILLVCTVMFPATRGAPPGAATPAVHRRPAAPAWTLVWSDEFDGPALDRSKWTVMDATRPNYDGGINYYDPSNVYLQNGNLVLRTEYHRRQVGRNVELYSSGKVKSEGKFSFLYGKVDIRAKLPTTQGLWPALWMLPADDTWPPEIDIMESLGNDPSRVYMTLHWGPRKKPLHYQAKFDGPNFAADYHVFSVEWEAGQIHWLVDGVERGAAVKNVPTRAMFLLLNTSIGGEWPGPPGRETVLPQYFLIDYVRFYKRAS